MIKGRRLFQLSAWLKALWDHVIILYYAWRHPLTPKYLKGLLTALIIYLVSPIDLVPDYLPFVGIVDDATLFTVAMMYLDHVLPAPVLAESRRQSEKWRQRMPYILGMIALAAIAWIVIVIMVIRKLLQ